MKRRLHSYFMLTKPTIMLLVLVTGATALVMEGSMLAAPVDFLLVMFALYCTGGAANALNQIFERDVDALMSRTRNKRPLPLKQLSSQESLFFALALGLSGLLIFYLHFNVLSTLLALATILFYSFLYTLWLKPNTHQNIVIGGAAGAMGPIIAWAAATGGLAMTPWLLFLIIFLWTPPHFWALALCVKDDYRKAQYPMLPIVKGDDATLRQIFWYSLAMVGISLGLIVETGWLYLVVALLAGFLFIRKARLAMRFKTVRLERGLFGYSILYLFVLFITLIVERFV